MPRNRWRCRHESHVRKNRDALTYAGSLGNQRAEWHGIAERSEQTWMVDKESRVV